MGLAQRSQFPCKIYGNEFGKKYMEINAAFPKPAASPPSPLLQSPWEISIASNPLQCTLLPGCARRRGDTAPHSRVWAQPKPPSLS